MPCAEDLIHDQDTILRLVTVLEGREKTYRKEFRALLDLFVPDNAAELRETFKASLLGYLDRALEIYDRLKPAVSSDLPDLMEELVRSSDPLRKADRRSELPEIYFLLLAPDLICYPQSAMQEELRSRKAAELLSGYGTSVPYELCAAYLLLEWEGDALANLNALTAVVMTCALRHLPWAQDDFGARGGCSRRARRTTAYSMNTARIQRRMGRSLWSWSGGSPRLSCSSWPPAWSCPETGCPRTS